MSILEFKPKDQKPDESGHATGEAFCIDCGNQLFYLTQEGHLYANCGTYQRYE